MNHTHVRRSRETVGLIVQLTDLPGTQAEQRIGALIDNLERRFAEAGLGELDGRDDGGGKVNVFIYDIAEANWPASEAIAVEEVHRSGLQDRAIIVRSVGWESDECDGWAEHEITWPSGHAQDFSVW